MERLRSKIRNLLTTRNVHIKIFLAEFLGTFVLMLFGDASVAQVVLSGGASGHFLTINLAWGLAVAMAVWVAGESSGGHVNPAVTLTLCILGRCRWILLPVYFAGQYLGAIVASAVTYLVYYEALMDYDGGVRLTDPALAKATAGIWSTYPKDYLSAAGGFIDQVVATAMLMLCIMAITDDKNQKPSKGMTPLCVGLIVAVIGMSLGHNCGYAINPARDWGPRIFTCMAGWGKEPFSFRHYNWFWVPFVGPHVGAVVGGCVYLVFVGNHLTSPDGEDNTRQYDVTPEIPPKTQQDNIAMTIAQ